MALSVTIGNEKHPCRVIRTGRQRSIGIEVSPYRGIVVHAPRHLNNQRLQELLEGSTRWIANRLAQLGKVALAPRTFKTGDRFLFLGQWLELQVLENAAGRGVAKRQDDRLTVCLPEEAGYKMDDGAVKSAVAKWYRAQARDVLLERVEQFAPVVGVPTPPIRINSASRRWGSCGAKGSLNFPWRLVMAPLILVDYVVVHELCHLLRRDHSPAFWRLVAAVVPDYQQRRRQLRRDGPFFDL